MSANDSLRLQFKSNLVDLREDLKPARLLPVLPAGLMNGLTASLVVTSLSSLIFSVSVPEYLPLGVSLAMICVVIGNLSTTLFSSYPATIYVIQDGPAAIMALAATSIALQLSSSPEMQLPTVLAALALSAILTGIAFWLLGVFQLGGMIRYIPYPVIGGFLAGTGWLLFKGSLDLTINQSLTLAGMLGLWTTEKLLYWLPPLVLALALITLLRRVRDPFLLTYFSIGIVATFYITLALTGTSVDVAEAQGWLMGGMNGSGGWQVLTPAMLSRVSWPALLGELPNILTVVFTSLIALLLGATGLEVSARRPISLNNELKTFGLANIVTGLLGGMVGYPAISLSVTGARVRIHSRVFPLLTGLTALLIQLVGLGLFRFFPRPLLGFLLFFFGLSFMIDWLVDGWKRLSRADYVIVWLILVVVAALGFLEGVLVGVFVSLLLFVVSYSQVDVVARQLDGSHYASRMDRRQEHRDLLHIHGKQVLALRLRGFIFFGTANSIQSRLLERLNDKDLLPLRYLILDFRRVQRLDSSATNSFSMMQMRAESAGFQILFSGLDDAQRVQLEREWLTESSDSAMRSFNDMDSAMEWCEDQLLLEFGQQEVMSTQPLNTVLKELLPNGVDVKKLAGYFERQECPETKILIRQGDAPQGLYLLESGRVRVMLEQPNGPPVWLRSMESGVIFGEMQVYSGKTASATVETTGPTVVQYLSAKKLAVMEKKDPELAIAFHRLIANVIGARLTVQNSTLSKLLDD